MATFRICRDLAECRRLWQNHWPRRAIFDLWDVRQCFQEGFDRPPYFVVAEAGGRFQGMLALSWIQEEQAYGHFPGETWQGRTWLEQNRIIAKDSMIFQGLLGNLPDSVDIRYLTHESAQLDTGLCDVDETGYLLRPKRYGHAFDAYVKQFSKKSWKKIRHEVGQIEKCGVGFRHNHIADVDTMFEMNISRFGKQSYFSDFRFSRSFERLMSLLHATGMLRITTALVGGRIAGVDIGAVMGSSYTVLAGGTSPHFPGIAKLMNLHHIAWACRRKLGEIDFLCGEFGWKRRFHLEPRPLYALNRAAYKPAAKVLRDRMVHATADAAG